MNHGPPTLAGEVRERATGRAAAPKLPSPQLCSAIAALLPRAETTDHVRRRLGKELPRAETDVPTEPQVHGVGSMLFWCSLASVRKVRMDGGGNAARRAAAVVVGHPAGSGRPRAPPP